MITSETTRQIFQWNKTDYHQINYIMLQYSSEFLTNFSSETPVEVLWSAFKSVCSECLDLIPSTLSSKKHLKAPWINTHINRLSNRKKRAYNRARNTGLPSDWSAYRSLKKLCQKECRKAHDRYLQQPTNPNHDTNHKRLWSCIKSKRQDNFGIPTLKDSNGTYNTLASRANVLNTVGRIIFEDKKFRGFRGYLVNLENKYPCNFLYIRLVSSFNTWWGIRTRSMPRHMSNYR